MNLPNKGSATVWVSRFGQCQSPSLLSTYKNLLSVEEHERLNTLVFERDKRSYLISRALIRTLLSQYTETEPGKLTFGAGKYGKPHLTHPNLAPGSIHFNLSHTDDLAIACISFGNMVGIDIESTLGAPPMEVMRDHFTSDEISELMACPLDARFDRFWSVWTLKESCIKATGEGLSTPLNQLGFSLIRQGGIRLLTKPESPSFEKLWWFAQWRPSPHYMAALCLEWNERTEPLVKIYECVPLQRTQKINVYFERVSFQF